MANVILCFKKSIFVLAIGVCWMGAQAETLFLKSPDGKLTLGFSIEESGLSWNLKKGTKTLVNDSRLGLQFEGQTPLAPFKIVKKEQKSSDSTWKTMLYRRGEVRDHYNELTVWLEEAGKEGSVPRKLGLVFRAYDEGVAFRYVIPEQNAFDGFQLMQDLTEWRLPGDPEGWITTYKSHFTSQEEEFPKQKVGSVPKDRLIGMPAVIEVDGLAIALCEANLTNWAGMFYRVGGQTQSDGESDGGQTPKETVLEAVLTPLPKTEAATANVAVIRKTPAESPWRVVMVGDSPLDLLRKNDIIVNLNPPPEEGLDFGWVKPGPSSWDWWTDSNNSLSTELTLNLIDFAAEMGWPYHTIDGGWYGFARRPNHGPDVELEPRKDFDLKRIVAHANGKGVGLWVWIHWMEIDDVGIEETFSRLEKWGIKGVKTDFINRQDQWAVNWYDRVCRAAAKHHVMVNFHGAHKPTGTERTWPNNLTREGILGNEMNKFRMVTPEHCATLPFTRFLIGPGDFTPGSFGNVFSKDFVPQSKRGHRYGDETDRREIWAEEVGTRAQSLAKCIAYDSPLTTLCDWPQRYRKAPGIEALRRLPTVWKSTKPIDGRPGEFYAVLRESHDGKFYFAAFSVKKRLIDLRLDFLDEGEWTMKVFADDAELTPGDARELETATRKVKKGQLTAFALVPEGGAVAIFERTSK